MLGISNEADLEAGTRNVGKSDGTDETLILGGIVILKGNLDLNSFLEVSLLNVPKLIHLQQNPATL